MHHLENHNPISFKVKCSRHSCVSVSKQCKCDVHVYHPVHWEPDKMLWPATSKSISTKSHLVILAAPTAQGGRGAFDCVRGHLQSIAGSYSASGCPFTAHGPRRMNRFVSRAPPAPCSLHPLLTSGASSSSVWFFYSFLPALAPSPQALSGRSLSCNSLCTCIPLSQMPPLPMCLITPPSARAEAPLVASTCGSVSSHTLAGRQQVLAAICLMAVCVCMCFMHVCMYMVSFMHVYNVFLWVSLCMLACVFIDVLCVLWIFACMSVCMYVYMSVCLSVGCGLPASCLVSTITYFQKILLDGSRGWLTTGCASEKIIPTRKTATFSF